ncbi:methylmalonyl Co-A mutase-associated GTPase MeaB [Plebeiibacterium marinum]|uniref:Methylmalonyl Co-A mutase-associated GTPase MeaB n=1 Tax=Plebeiibacterium marinum TaxID=2992111 RepID=A0AAE3SHX8_9BACT|nr:methylmalonyl Co-A mutase-associated GTPase MeaB [Plebeiobacterium marinum]MCW3804052.1 methylmalonyl Co-A mutase-associated GTPase MeaB [Plebeiobacterium marinum]
MQHDDHIENHDDFKNLVVNKGVEQVQTVNSAAAKRFLAKKRKLPTVDQFFEGIREGDITLLSQAVTLVESARPDHQKIAQQIIEKCLPFAGNSLRLGITGVPGAGKSTTIEALGMHVINKGGKLAVLAIDPSSERSKGSILGDKTRMEELSAHPKAYIRPSPSAGSLGGVARKTRETIILCEAAGFDTIFIETVGVGQSETAVHSMVDFFLLIMLAGAGDELQGIKRGIMEMADAIAINKADGNNVRRASMAKAEYTSALHLFPPTKSGWTPIVKTCSALENTGIAELWDMVLEYADKTNKNGYFAQRRSEQSKYWMLESINEALQSSFYHNSEIKKAINTFEQKVTDNEVSSFAAAQELLNMYFNKINK